MKGLVTRGSESSSDLHGARIPTRVRNLPELLPRSEPGHGRGRRPALALRLLPPVTEDVALEVLYRSDETVTAQSRRSGARRNEDGQNAEAAQADRLFIDDGVRRGSRQYAAEPEAKGASLALDSSRGLVAESHRCW